MESAHIFVNLLFNLQEGRIALFKLLDLSVLVGKGFHLVNTEQAVLNLGVKLANDTAALLEALLHLCSEARHTNDHYGNDGEDEKCEGNVYCAKNCKGCNYLDARDKEFLGAVVCKFGNVKEVACNSRHKSTDFCVVII